MIIGGKMMNWYLQKKAAGLLSVSEDLKLQPGIYKMEFNAGDEIVGKNFRYKAVVSET